MASLEERYREAVDHAVLEACERQNMLSERMKHVEDLAKRTAAMVPRGDTTAAEALLSLEDTLSSVMTTLDDTVASIKAIDDVLPPQDRLMAPGMPHRDHYPILHSLLGSQGPFIMPAAQPRQSVTRTDAEVCKDDKHEPPRAADTLRYVMAHDSNRCPT